MWGKASQRCMSIWEDTMYQPHPMEWSIWSERQPLASKKFSMKKKPCYWCSVCQFFKMIAKYIHCVLSNISHHVRSRRQYGISVHLIMWPSLLVPAQSQVGRSFDQSASAVISVADGGGSKCWFDITWENNGAEMIKHSGNVARGQSAPKQPFPSQWISKHVDCLLLLQGSGLYLRPFL